MGSQTNLFDQTGSMRLIPFVAIAAKIIAAETSDDIERDYCEMVWRSCVEGDENSLCLKSNEAMQIGREQICPDSVCFEKYLSDSLKRDKDFRKFCRRSLRSTSNCPPGGCSSGFDISAINGYGCWCHFGQDLMKGGGPAQNPFDDVCRDLQLCLRCAKYDGMVDGYNCDPKTETYSAVGTPSFNYDCSAGNQGDSCKEHICSCNYEFLTSLLYFVFDNSVQYEDTYLHGQWDNLANCPTIYDNDAEKSCCGYYPKRYPFNIGSKACCTNQLYSPINEVCCDYYVPTVAQTVADCP